MTRPYDHLDKTGSQYRSRNHQAQSAAFVRAYSRLSTALLGDATRVIDTQASASSAELAEIGRRLDDLEHIGAIAASLLDATNPGVRS
ncbi:MAG TPA: hypothetical protein VFB41_07655 [Solirubrobacteraceae bacterium]|nr:hypothetical protein [Solirubrobacteraceae bacterium]